MEGKRARRRGDGLLRWSKLDLRNDSEKSQLWIGIFKVKWKDAAGKTTRGGGPDVH